MDGRHEGGHDERGKWNFNFNKKKGRVLCETRPKFREETLTLFSRARSLRAG